MYTLPKLPFKTLKGEIWKTVPGSKGCYWMSNCGRTISARTGYRFLKPLIRYSKDGEVSTVQVEMTYGGQRRMITLSKMVYNLFVQKISPANTSIIIKHKDGNRLNCKSKNLVASTFSEVLRNSFISGTRGNNFQDQAKPVSQYSFEGKFIATYSSAAEAQRKTAIQRRNINRAAREKRVSMGYLWRYGKPKKQLTRADLRN